MTRKLLFLSAGTVLILAFNVVIYADSVPIEQSGLSTRSAGQGEMIPDSNLRNIQVVKSARLMAKENSAFVTSSGAVSLSNSVSGTYSVTSSSSSENGGPTNGGGSAVPEPLSLILLGTGLTGLAAALRRSRSS